MDVHMPLTFYLRNFSELGKSRYSLVNILLSYFSTIADNNFFVHFSVQQLYRHFAKLYKEGWSIDGCHKTPFFSYTTLINTLKDLDKHNDIVFLKI